MRAPLAGLPEVHLILFSANKFRIYAEYLLILPVFFRGSVCAFRICSGNLFMNDSGEKNLFKTTNKFAFPSLNTEPFVGEELF